MGNPVTTKSQGICFAFPNVCFTPPVSLPFPSGVPIPYPSIGQLSDATVTAASVKAGGNEVVTKSSKIMSTTGDSAGSLLGVISGSVGGKVEFATASSSVFAEGVAVVRMFDTTKQNNGNAQGIVLGGVPTVLVGG
jgi:Domain of unknown function (DUF4150)